MDPTKKLKPSHVKLTTLDTELYLPTIKTREIEKNKCLILARNWQQFLTTPIEIMVSNKMCRSPITNSTL